MILNRSILHWKSSWLICFYFLFIERPIEKPNVAPTKKVERRNEAKQKSDNEIEAHSKTPADDEGKKEVVMMLI